MIKKEICQQVLEECLKTGGDFAEIFAEDTEKNIMDIDYTENGEAAHLKFNIATGERLD